MAGYSETARSFWHTTAAVVAAVAVLSPSIASAQPSRQPVTDPTTNRPVELAYEPINIGEVVYSWYILNVGTDASLTVDTEEGQRTIELWPVAIPGGDTQVGINARRYLRSLVGRKVQFAFRERSRAPRTDDRNAPPWTRAFAEVGVELVKRGLARYCPPPGVRFEHLELMQERAQQRELGLWKESSRLACPRAP